MMKYDIYEEASSKFGEPLLWNRNKPFFCPSEFSVLRNSFYNQNKDFLSRTI